MLIAAMVLNLFSLIVLSNLDAMMYTLFLMCIMCYKNSCCGIYLLILTWFGVFEYVILFLNIVMDYFCRQGAEPESCFYVQRGVDYNPVVLIIVLIYLGVLVFTGEAAFRAYKEIEAQHVEQGEGSGGGIGFLSNLGNGGGDNDPDAPHNDNNGSGSGYPNNPGHLNNNPRGSTGRDRPTGRGNQPMTIGDFDNGGQQQQQGGMFGGMFGNAGSDNNNSTSVYNNPNTNQGSVSNAQGLGVRAGGNISRDEARRQQMERMRGMNNRNI
eukprot:Mrub_07195.p1 GENE.Mrub_07195~~Mrub_07195.p1  ORF type:complete len:296 (-),score=75.11 Mrub_07195:55-858(-)